LYINLNVPGIFLFAMNGFVYAIASILGAILLITGIDAFIFIRELLARQ
jgi:hypothetical protein